MAKTKHHHIIEATVRLRKAFDPGNLSAAADIQKSLTDVAAKMDGFHSVETRMTKAPAPAVDPLAIPAGLARK